MKRFWLFAMIVGVGLTLGSMSLTKSARADAPDPRAPGPYAVGIVKDSVTNGGKTIPLYFLYPVNKASITASSTKFDFEQFWDLYPDGTPVITPVASALWESHGFDPAYVAAPAASGAFPVVVAPDFLGGEQTNNKLLTHLASQGYVVASVFLSTTDYPIPNGLYCPKNPAPQDGARLLLQRSQNDRLMLDRLLSRNATSGDLLFGKVDAKKVAAVGFSYGGLDALILGSGISTPNGSLPPDPRIKAIVSLDGSSSVLAEAELKRISVPYMVLGTPAGPDGRFPAGNQNARAHALVSSRIKYRVDIASTIHGSFGVSSCAYYYTAIDAGFFGTPHPPYSVVDDWGCTSPVLPEAQSQNTILTYVTSFLKTHLDNVSGYGNVLTPGWSLTSDSNADFFENSNGTFQNVPLTNPCHYRNEGNYSFNLRQPGKTTSNASTARSANGAGLPAIVRMKLDTTGAR